ncbi:MAG TPA: hypothetical protein VNX87_01450 [Candidatus Sulfotelmatobacter sp.]|jgi:hypothetical protein|nr:hypothetical protein [Candidatus Sulfotelmatobacter sp.]
MNLASPSQRLLRKALVANAGFSFLSSMIIVGWQHQLVRLLGIPPKFNPLSLAFALALFAIWLLVCAVRNQIKLLDARLAVGMDLAWVIASLPVVAFTDLTRAGKLVVGIVAMIVLCFTLGQWIGIRRILSDRQGKMQEVRGA